MRNIGRYRRKKQKKLIIIGSISLLLFLCVGYAAFSTNLKVMTKANIKDRYNLYVASYGNDVTGNGTKEKPFQTIEKAYDSAWQHSTIYVMDNITQKSKVTMDDNKDVVITSYSENGSINSIIRDSSLTTHLIDVQNGILTLENITINGNDIPSQDSMINVASEVYMEKETLITKANNINDWGGGFSVNGGTLTMNDGTISECNSNAHGGAAVFVFYDHQEGDNVENNKEGTFILNGGNISNNNGGAIIWTAGIMTMTGGNINNNTSTETSILRSNGELNISGGYITQNNTLTNHGTVSCNSYINRTCTMTMTGGTISNNTMHSNGAVNIQGRGNFTLDGGNIMNNTSTNSVGGIYVIGVYKYISGVVCGNIPANQYETSSTCPS